MHLDLRREEHQGQRDQEHAGAADGDRLAGEEEQDQAQRAQQGGEDQAGMGQLRADARHRPEQEQEEEVGPRDHREHLLAPVHGHRPRGLSLQVQRDGAAVEALDLFSIQRAQERGHVGNDQVDELPLERLPLGERPALQDRLLRQLDVAAPAFRLAADVGGGVGRHLLGHRLVHRPQAGDGMGGPDIGAGGHRGDVGDDRDDEAGGGGPRSRGPHPDRHRHPGPQDAVDDLAHRRVESAGGVDPDHDQGGARRFRPVERRHHVARAHGMDRALELDDRDLGSGDGGAGGDRGRQDRTANGGGHGRV